VSRTEYYRQMRLLAAQVRDQYGLETPRVLKSDLRRIYKDQGIHIDLWPYKLKKLRGAYFFDDDGASVLLAKGLPDAPTIFTMGHELKHHLADRDSIVSLCDPSNQSTEIEIGAEIFAAELIYPEHMFRDHLFAMGVTTGSCTPQHIVRLKRDTQTTLSYTGLAKRAEFLGLAPQLSLAKVPWKKLEEQMFGVPLYKQLLSKRRVMLKI
jgi:Zn-dependent peptidase ImmA (M78 family)